MKPWCVAIWIKGHRPGLTYGIVYYAVVLTFKSVEELMTIWLKASEQYFYMVLFRILYKTIGLDSANPCV